MGALRDAATQAWPPFVLIAALLLVGGVAGAAGLFERAGAFVGRLPGSAATLLFTCMGHRRPAPGPTERTATVGVLLARGLTIGLTEPALPVLATGLVTAAVACHQRTTTPRRLLSVVGPHVLGALFALSVALGVLARTWDGPSAVLMEAGRWETAAIAAVASVALNNPPAATLLSAGPVEHARALLIGLNLGPNLAVTGSLSSYLWHRSAKTAGAQPSIAATVSRLGLVLGPAAIIAATWSLSLGGAR